MMLGGADSVSATVSIVSRTGVSQAASSGETAGATGSGRGSAAVSSGSESMSGGVCAGSGGPASRPGAVSVDAAGVVTGDTKSKAGMASRVIDESGGMSASVDVSGTVAASGGGSGSGMAAVSGVAGFSGPDAAACKGAPHCGQNLLGRFPRSAPQASQNMDLNYLSKKIIVLPVIVAESDGRCRCRYCRRYSPLPLFLHSGIRFQ
ncbi:MAG: hypothetical protein LBP86_10925 [Azoarcus sp.]|nr:hypothetical protein [Azoarcus sp.]